MNRLLIAVGCAALLVGCSNAESDEEQLRDALTAYTRDLTSGNFADACRRTANPSDCIAGLRADELAAGGREELLVAWGDIDPSALIDGARKAQVEVSGDRATLDNPVTEETGVPAVRKDGNWKILFPTE